MTSNKAVAHGAILSHIDCSNHRVAMQVACVTYGLVCMVPANKDDEGHIHRKLQWIKDLDGEWYVPDHFDTKLHKVSPFWCSTRYWQRADSHSKGAKVPEQMEFRDSFMESISNVSDLGMVRASYTYYRSKLSKPEWLDDDACSLAFFSSSVISFWLGKKNAASLSTIFEVHADLSMVTEELVWKKNPSGKTYYKLEYNVIVYFRLTEIKAEVGWQTEVCVKSYVLQSSDLIVIPEWRTPVSVQSIHLVGSSNLHVSIPATVVFEEWGVWFMSASFTMM